jgi:hypothetical protein
LLFAAGVAKNGNLQDFEQKYEVRREKRISLLSSPFCLFPSNFCLLLFAFCLSRGCAFIDVSRTTAANRAQWKSNACQIGQKAVVLYVSR